MRRVERNAALVLFSGGQDSATALAWALDRFARVETIGFDYGQRHAIELKARDGFRLALSRTFPQWAGRLGADALVDLKGLGAISETAMTRETEIFVAENGLPTTFVPGRNLAFLVMAAAHAYRRNIGALVVGMCETDFSGYPDCRRETLDAQIKAINLGMEADFSLEAPLMALTKGETFELAQSLGGDTLVDLIIEETHSCYIGDRSRRHDWGYGCGVCPACELRAKGWREFVSAQSMKAPRS